MMYVLDTSTCSDLMYEEPAAVRRLETMRRDHTIVTCVIVRGEILFGIEKLQPGKRREELAGKARHLFAWLPCEPIRSQAADVYAHIKRSRQLIGLPLDENDLWIASN